MAQDSVQSSNGPQNAPPPNPYLTQLTAAVNNGGDEDEWEYEYSTTETEIYYVTLDLTTAQGVEPEDGESKKPRNKAKNDHFWAHPGLRDNLVPSEEALRKRREPPKQKRGGNRRGPTVDPQRFGASRENTTIDKDGVDDEFGSSAVQSPEKMNTDSPTPPPDEKKDERPTQIQILDLHTKNPVVSYGGEVFACEWKKNMGTEFLFVEHDDHDPLPVLRNVTDGVDLIAASSIRIMSNPVILEPRFTAQQGMGSEGWKAESTEPAEKNEKQKRQEQNSFLSQLRQVKKRKGEHDAVTTQAKTLPRKEHGALQNTVRAAERERLGLIIAQNQDMYDVETAKKRLKTMDAEEKRRRYTGTTRGTPKKRRPSELEREVSDLDPTPGTTPGPDQERRGSMSYQLRNRNTQSLTPQAETPMKNDWEAAVVDDDDMDSDGLYDEDAPFEDDDAVEEYGWE